MSSHDDRREDLYYVQSLVADLTTDAAAASQQAVGLTDTRHPVMDLDSTHGKLTEAYSAAVRALDRVENEMDSIDEDWGSPTPRRIISEHTTRLEEQYDGPVLNLAQMLLEHNRRAWLHHKDETNGAESVRRHGLTENQRRWLNQLQDAWGVYDDGE
jgi:uncharacterized protein YecT (DUF1311 family)